MMILPRDMIATLADLSYLHMKKWKRNGKTKKIAMKKVSSCIVQKPRM